MFFLCPRVALHLDFILLCLIFGFSLQLPQTNLQDIHFHSKPSQRQLQLWRYRLLFCLHWISDHSKTEKMESVAGLACPSHPFNNYHTRSSWGCQVEKSGTFGRFGQNLSLPDSFEENASRDREIFCEVVNCKYGIDRWCTEFTEFADKNDSVSARQDVSGMELLRLQGN